MRTADGYSCTRGPALVVVKYSQPVYAGDAFHKRLRKPKTFAVAVTAALLDVKWRGWDRSRAVGHGRFGERGQRLGRATIELSKPILCAGRITYSAGRYRIKTGPWSPLRFDSGCRLGV